MWQPTMPVRVTSSVAGMVALILYTLVMQPSMPHGLTCANVPCGRGCCFPRFIPPFHFTPLTCGNARLWPVWFQECTFLGGYLSLGFYLIPSNISVVIRATHTPSPTHLHTPFLKPPRPLTPSDLRKRQYILPFPCGRCGCIPPPTCVNTTPTTVTRCHHHQPHPFRVRFPLVSNVCARFGPSPPFAHTFGSRPPRSPPTLPRPLGLPDARCGPLPASPIQSPRRSPFSLLCAR